MGLEDEHIIYLTAKKTSIRHAFKPHEKRTCLIEAKKLAYVSNSKSFKSKLFLIIVILVKLIRAESSPEGVPNMRQENKFFRNEVKKMFRDK